MAGHLALRGFNVSLFELPQFGENIKAIQLRGGIEVEVKNGVDLPSGFGKLNKITTKVEEVVKDADVLCVVVPSFAHEAFAKACRCIYGTAKLCFFIQPIQGAPFLLQSLEEYEGKK